MRSQSIMNNWAWQLSPLNWTFFLFSQHKKSIEFNELLLSLQHDDEDLGFPMKEKLLHKVIVQCWVKYDKNRRQHVYREVHLYKWWLIMSFALLIDIHVCVASWMPLGDLRRVHIYISYTRAQLFRHCMKLNLISFSSVIMIADERRWDPVCHSSSFISILFHNLNFAFPLTSLLEQF